MFLWKADVLSLRFGFMRSFCERNRLGIDFGIESSKNRIYILGSGA